MDARKLASFNIQTRDNIPRYQCDNPIIHLKRILASNDFPAVSSLTLCSMKGVTSLPVIPAALEIVKPVLSDHIKQDIFRLFRQVVAYCCIKVVQKASAGYCCIKVVQKAHAGAFCATFIQQ